MARHCAALPEHGSVAAQDDAQHHRWLSEEECTAPEDIGWMPLQMYAQNSCTCIEANPSCRTCMCLKEETIARFTLVALQ